MPAADTSAPAPQRRQRGLPILRVLTLIALVMATAVSAWIAWHEQHARHAAERERAIAAEVAQFVNEMFNGAAAESSQRTLTTAADMLDRADKRLQLAPPKDPRLAAAIGMALARIALAMGQHELAQKLVNAAGKTLDGLDANAQIARIEAAILSLQIRLSRAVDAGVEQSARDLIAEIGRQRGRSNSQEYEARNLLGYVLFRQGKFQEAIAEFEKILDAPVSRLPIDDRQRERAFLSVAQALQAKGDLVSAIKVLTQLEEDLGKRHGENDPETLDVVSALAAALGEKGEYDSALKLYDRAYAGRSQLLGPAHPGALVERYNRAVLLVQAARSAEAEPVLRSLLAQLTENGSANAPEVTGTMSLLAHALEQIGRVDEAAPMFRDVLARETSAGMDIDATFDTRAMLADSLLRKGDLTAAEKEYIALLDAASEKRGVDDTNVLMIANAYGECLLRLGRFDEAEPLLIKTQTALFKALGPKHELVAKARSRLADLYVAMKQPERAAPWRAPPPEIVN